MDPRKEMENFQAEQKKPLWNYLKRSPKIIQCPNCGYEGPGQAMVEGSTCLEVVLWLCFLIPGLIYSVWRWTSGQYIGCPKCGWKHVKKMWL